MEQHVSFRRGVSDRGAFPLGRAPLGKQDEVPCGLPLGTAMVCGSTRRREDRAADSEVISGGGRSRDIWFLKSGILRLQRYGLDGRRQILSLFLPGEIVGFEGEFREGVTVETATQCSLCRIDRRWLSQMVDRHDNLRAELFSQKHDQLDRLHWLTLSLGALKPEERLCAFFAMSSRFMPYQPLPDGTGILTLHLPRKDIADLLGTSVESISRIVHRLAAMGVIEIKDPVHFRLRDMARLVEIGKIDGLLESMTANLSTRRKRLEHLALLGSAASVCACGV